MQILFRIVNFCAILFLFFELSSCAAHKYSTEYKSQNIEIEQLSENSFRHISYLQTNDFGKVACNGMIVIDQDEALIFDTPTNNQDAQELIEWVEINLKAKVIGVVITHFHEDCLGGLAEFHRRGIPSYALNKTIELATKNNSEIPQFGFDQQLELSVGNEKVENIYFGEGHTIDNIVSYFPAEKVLFGGCLVKTLDASKGYLGDANVQAWSTTVAAVQEKFSDAKIIIPGHGNVGGQKLLAYTIQLFQPENGSK